ncbi:MAG: phytanoyl-CoA dioxygenase [Micavibrio sp.]|nr:phytanoyl-CoA dioxygenase [Micavibrio sp.]|tara:strand:- start:3897 stop:4682 length:786 start_codon:yes stop_codon:yes gene_type:complete
MTQIDIEKHEKEITEKGWTAFRGVYSAELIAKACEELDEIRPTYDEIHKEQGVYEETKNAYHHTVVLSPAQLEMINPNPLHGFLENYFGGRYILNTMGTSYVLPQTGIYTQRIHRDIRSFSGKERLTVNTLIMLDDCTEENGATWMLEGSQYQDDKPDEDFFYKNSVRATGKAGDILVFDSNIWHAAGTNNSDKVRRIITPFFSKPLMKQSLDYPRAFGYDFANRIPDELKQILGYNALTPVTLSEFYKPREKRFYKADQG